MAEKKRSELATVRASEPDIGARISNAVLHFIAEVPRTDQLLSSTPAESSRQRAKLAAKQAAAAAGALALPPGPAGWLTILPEMVAVWKIQAQMVADIAALYGKTGALSQEHMLYCLFKQTASQAVRDLVVRMGERLVVKSVSIKVLSTVAKRIGINLTQRALGKGVSRLFPVIGAVGVAAYAYYDTTQVANVAIKLFEQDLAMASTPDVPNHFTSP